MPTLCRDPPTFSDPSRQSRDDRRRNALARRQRDLEQVLPELPGQETAIYQPLLDMNSVGAATRIIVLHAEAVAKPAADVRSCRESSATQRHDRSSCPSRGRAEERMLVESGGSRDECCAVVQDAVCA